MSENRQDRIDRRADELWRRDGSPDTPDTDHWRRQAEQELAHEAAEASAAAMAERPPRGTPPLSPDGGVAGPRQPRRSGGAKS